MLHMDRPAKPGHRRSDLDRKDSFWSAGSTTPPKEGSWTQFEPAGLWTPPHAAPVQDPMNLPLPLYPTIAGETRPYRNVRCLKGLRRTPETGVRTVAELIRRSVQKYGSAPAVASRRLIATHSRQVGVDASGNTKALEMAELTGYEFTSYLEYEKLVNDLGSGLLELGLKPREDRLCIWAQTCADWLAMFHAAASRAIPIVTAYSSLGVAGLQHALKSTKASSMFVDAQGFERLCTVLEAAPLLRTIFYGGNVAIAKDKCAELYARFPNVRFLHVCELRLSGASAPTESSDPRPDDLCAIFYTSGSTGDPKGVPLQHRHAVATVAGWDNILGRHLSNADRYLSYLPLAHIMEFGLSNLSFYRGVCIGYGSPRTLFDSTVHGCKGDFRELQPSWTVGVPAIWESVRKTVVANIGTLSPNEQTGFWQAFDAAKKASSKALPSPGDVDDKFAQGREMLGGRLKFAVTGGGPIAADTQEFISHAIVPLCGGFGMTETAGIAGVTDPDDWRGGFGSLGSVPDCAELKLVDEPEAGYLTSNSPPEGEIWVRSHSATDHYYDDETETAKAFTKDGWFKTGDIGRIDFRGAVSVIDRKKNLVKTLNGEYIALEKLEAVYRSCEAVLNVCIHADNRRKKPIAIVLPNRPAVQAMVECAASTDSAQLTAHLSMAEHLVLKQLQQRAQAQSLAGIETVEGVIFSHLEEWSPINGTMSAVGKPVRRRIFKAHEGRVDQLLAALGPA